MKKKYLCIAGFLQSGALYATITHDTRSEYNQQKSECRECQWSWGVWICSETPAGPLRTFLSSEEHLNWLKIDLNAAEIITIRDYKHTQNLCEWKYIHIYSAKAKSQYILHIAKFLGTVFYRTPLMAASELKSNISHVNRNKSKKKLFFHFDNSHTNQTILLKRYFFIHC